MVVKISLGKSNLFKRIFITVKDEIVLVIALMLTLIVD